VASVIFGTGVAIAAPSFEEQMKEINADARDAREIGNLELVEQKRRERWLLIAEFAGKKDPPDSPWVHAYKAIEVVDGSEKSTEEDAGLLNALKYRESCAVLKTAFDEMVAAGDGPLLGEVATRLFEVAQQAKGVFREALVPGSPDSVADVVEIAQALEVASKRDPCCVSAVAMLLYIQRPDSKEAFLRADMRDSFKRRQKQLVEISHPLILPKQAGSSSEARNTPPPGGDTAAAKKEVKIEHEDAPVMPWHAAVELDKAMSLQYILDDLEYTKNLTPDQYLFDANGVQVWTIPGRLFSGTDAELSPCQLIYGQILLARTSVAGGARRSVAFFLTTAFKDGKKQFLWDHRHIDLLWRVPTAEELAKDATLRRKQELLGAHAARKKWKLGDQEFQIYDFPIRDTERCLQERLRVLCVKSTDAVERSKFAPGKNSPELVSNMQTSAERLARTPFMTSSPVQASVNAFKQSNDPTKHGLIELLRDPLQNPMVVVSELKAGSKPGDKSPNLHPGDTADEAPYIMLDEGRKLYIAVAGRPESPCSWVEYDGATAYMPLSPKAIPRAILLGSEIGTAFIKVLQAAGYTEEEAVSEIMKAMNEGGDYIPARFKQLLTARINALVKETLKNNLELKTKYDNLDPWIKRFFGITFGQVTPDLFRALVAAEMLQEQGWFGSAELKPALEDMFQRFGFRYLRDRRGNWIMARKLIDDDGRLDTGREKGPVSLDDYPFAYMAQDGKKVVDKTLIYSWPEYLQIKESIVLEHLNKMLCFHPSLPAIELIQIVNEMRIQHPDFNAPDYMKGFVKMRDNNAVSGPGLNTSAIPKLTSPFPEWVVEGDETQAKSLGNLYSAYMKKLITANSETREMADIVDRLDSVKKLRQYFGEDEEVKKTLDEAYLYWNDRFANASRKQVQALLATWAVQLESGRNYARRKYFHKAIVWYNDLLSQLNPENDLQSKLLIFTNVPTTQTASLFVDNIQQLIQGQSLLINTQVELAGVLNASGLKPSAYFVWQRTVDDYDFFLKPALTIAEDMMQSYGLSMPRKAEAAAKSLEDTVEICRTAIRKYELAEDWQNLEAGAVKTVTVSGKKRRSVAEIRADLERDNAGKLSDAERERVERECEAFGSDRTITFVEWIDLKKALVEFRPTLAFRTASLSAPWLACPAPYDTENGFAAPADAARALISKADADSILRWCKKPLQDANSDPVAIEASSLLGWYWLDVGRESLARAAYVNLARIKRASAEKRQRSVEGLIDELHSYVAITAAGTSMGSMPGLSAYRADFSSLLEGQLLDWEKRWFAQGAYGPHASQQRLELLSLAERLKSQMMRNSRDWRSNRYFFPDYAFEYGAVPDYLAEILFKTPDLFRTLTEDEIKARGEDAVEGASWVLISEADAMAFLDSRVLNSEIDEALVFLGE